MVRIVSWDLHDLWHEPGKPLRRGASSRSVTDFEALRDMARRLKADIIALQGIGSPAAARKLFPARNYYVVFSRELAIRMGQDRDILTNPARRRVYTAIAIRRSARLRILAREQLLELADPSPGLGASRPQGQSALAIKVRINKRPVWIMTARLMSDCSRGNAKPAESGKKNGLSPHCTALRDQVRLLNVWKSRKTVRREAVVLAVALPQVRGSAIGNPTIERAWQTLTTSDPVKVAADDASKARTGIRTGFFVLSNTVANRKYGSSGPVRQPNTVALTGPSRPPGKRLVRRKGKGQASKDSNLVVEALTDFANTILRKKPAKVPPSKMPEAKTETLTLAERSLAALARVGENAEPVRQKTTAENKAVKRYFIRYPDTLPAKACNTRQTGSNNFLVDRSFHDANKGIRFAVAQSAGRDSGANTDCAIVLDIPRTAS